MDTKTLYIDEKLHRQIKMLAAIHGTTIKDWTETVLRNAVAAEGMTLVDPGVEYTTQKEADNA